MDSNFDFTTLHTIEERLEHALQYNRHKMRWIYPGLYLIGAANLVALVFYFDDAMRRETWALVTMTALCALNLLTMIGTNRYVKSFGRPSAEQKAAIEEALAARNYPLAIQLVDEMVTYIHDPEAHKLAAKVYMRGGRFHESEVTSQKAVEIWKRYPTSRSTKKELAEHKRNISDAQTLVGLSYIGQRRYAEAEQVFSEAMITDPSNGWPMSNYAEALLYQRKSIPVALDTIQKAETLWAKTNSRPKAAHATVRAWAHALQGDRPAAEEWIAQARQRAADYNDPALTSEVLYVVGLAYQALDDSDQAQRAFSESMQADPKGGLSGQLAKAKLAELSV